MDGAQDLMLTNGITTSIVAALFFNGQYIKIVFLYFVIIAKFPDCICLKLIL